MLQSPDRYMTRPTMVYDYPPFSELIGQELMQHYEFSSLTTGQQARLAPGDFFNYQLFGMRFVNEYAKVLCILEPGTGKTCYSVGSVERARMIEEIVDITLKRKRSIKHCYYVTTNDLLISEAEKQIICSCTNRRYLNDKIENSHMDTGRTKAVRAELNKFYTVLSYSNFHKEHIGSLTPDQLKEKFDDTFIILDEAHTLRNNIVFQRGEQNAIYYAIRDMLHVANTHTIVATATPMMDDVSEFVPLINYILPNDMQMDEDVDYTTWIYEDYAPYFRGRITYVRAESFGLDVIEGGVPLNSRVLYNNREFESQMNVVPLVMSQYQSDAYMALRRTKDYRANNYIRAKTMSTYYNRDHQRTMGNRAYNNAYNIPDAVVDDLYMYSCKFDAIIRSIENNPGKHFIYWSLLEGGLSILVAILQRLGYELFTGSSKDIFKRDRRKTINIGGLSKLASYCSEGSTGEGEIDEQRLPKRKRITLLCGNTRTRPSRTIRELYNHPLNTNGDYLQVFIGSSAVKLGMNLKDVRHVHIVGPEWNRGSIFQAERRAIRAESHLASIAQQQALIDARIAAGEELTPEEMIPHVDITINRYVAIPRYIDLVEYNNLMREQDNNWIDLDYNNPNDRLYRLLLDNIVEMTRGESVRDTRGCIDTYMYEISERKEMAIRQVMRYMKRYAIDCAVNKTRNMQDFGQGTIECDYDDCEYQCDVDYLDGELIEGVGSYKPAYNSLYTNRIIDRLDTIVKKNIGEYITIGWEDLFVLLGDQTLYNDAITYNIGRKLASRYVNNPVVIDKTGSPMFVGVNATGFYLSDKRPVNDKSTILTTDIIVTKNRNLKDYLADLIEAEQPMETRYVLSRELIDSLGSMSLIDISRVIEYAITVPDNPIAQEIMDYYQFYIYHTPRRELKSTGQRYRTDEDINISRDEEVVLMTFPTHSGSKFNISSSLRTPPSQGVRIFQDGRWDELKGNAYSMYKPVIQERLDALVEPFGGNTFAYYSQVDYNLRISPPGYRGPGDNRNIARGTVCGNIRLDTLVKSISDLGEDVVDRIIDLTGLSYPTDTQMATLPAIARVRDIDLDQFTEEYQRVLLYLLIDNYSTSAQICKRIDIEELYESYGRFLVT